MLTGLFSAALADPGLARARDLARSGAAQVDGLDLTAPAALRPFVVAAVAAADRSGGAGRPVLAVTATTREADDLAAALGGLLPPDQVAVFPSWETLPHERLSPRSDTVGRRLAVLRRLAHPESTTRTAHRAAAGGRGAGPLACSSRSSRASATWSRCELRHRRRGRPGGGRPPAGRHGVRPGRPGHQARRVRGARRHPGRLPAHRRAPVPGRVLGRRGGGDPHLRRRRPAHHRAGRRGSGRRPAGSCCSPRRSGSGPPRWPQQHPELAEILDKLAEGIPVEGMESLAPALLDGADVAGAAARLHAGRHPRAALRPGADPHPGARPGPYLGGVPAGQLGRGRRRRPGAGRPRRRRVQTLAEVRAHRRPRCASRGGRCRPFGAGRGGPAAAPTAALAEDAPDRGPPSTPDDADRGDPRRPAGAALPRRDRAGWSTTCKRWAGDGWRSRWSSRGTAPPSGRSRCCATPASASRSTERGRRPRPPPASCWSPAARSSTASSTRRPGSRVLTGNDITGGRGASTKDMRKMPSRRRNTIDPLELQAGDFVVHEQHGIGRYVELVQRTVNGADREYLVIEYAASKRGQPGDRLFVPTDQLDQLSRYVGGEQPDAAQDGRLGLAEVQGPGPQGGPGDRRPAHPALRGPPGVQGPRVRPGHAVAARAGGRLPVHRDAGPARRDRRGQARTWSSPSRWTG